MNAQLNTTQVSSEEVLNHALIQCLRLFARYGRKIRNQGQLTAERLSDNMIVKDEFKQSDQEENSAGELIYS